MGRPPSLGRRSAYPRPFPAASGASPWLAAAGTLFATSPAIPLAALAASVGVGGAALPQQGIRLRSKVLVQFFLVRLRRPPAPFFFGAADAAAPATIATTMSIRPFLFLLCLVLSGAARADDLHARGLSTRDYALAREVLVEAIEDEGLVLSSVSNFGEMLRRTDTDLGHGAGARFSHAEVFAFCSAKVAARLVLEAAERIAWCPLTIALYQEESSKPVRLAFRPPGGDSPGALDGLALLERLAGRVEDLLPRR